MKPFNTVHLSYVISTDWATQTDISVPCVRRVSQEVNVNQYSRRMRGIGWYAIEDGDWDMLVVFFLSILAIGYYIGAIVHGGVIAISPIENSIPRLSIL
jgi:hypothetical protein